MLRGDATIAAHVDAFTARNLEQGGTQPPPAKQPKLGPKPEPTLDDTVEPRHTKPPIAPADGGGHFPRGDVLCCDAALALVELHDRLQPPTPTRPPPPVERATP